MKLTSEYRYDGDYLCDTDVLASGFRFEAEPGRTTYLFGKEVRLADEPGVKTKSQILDYFYELQRCYQFDDDVCTRSISVGRERTEDDTGWRLIRDNVDFTLRRAFYFGERAAGETGHTSANEKTHQIETERFGDRYLAPLAQLEVVTEARRDLLRFDWLERIDERIVSAFHDSVPLQTDCGL